ncbi:MAG: hypothetical protein ABJN36_09470 [Cyclobacteriaceae bacterium]
MNKLNRLRLAIILIFIVCLYQSTLGNTSADYKLKTQISKTQIFECECVILKVKLEIKDGIKFPQNYSSFDNSISDLKTQINSFDAWYFHEYPENIGTDSVEVKGYKSWELFTTAMCPMHSGVFKIPPLKFSVKRRKFIVSESIEINVEKLPVEINRQVYKNDLFSLIGFFEILRTHITNDTVSLNEGVDISFSMRGRGIGYPIEVPFIDSDSFQITSYKSLTSNQIRDGYLFFEKTFSFTLSSNIAQQIDLSKLVSWFGYNEIKKEIIEGHLTGILTILNENENSIPKLENFGDSVVCLDVSESMQLEDYYPNRLEYAKKYLSEIKRIDCSIPIFMFSDGSIKTNICEDGFYQPLQSKRQHFSLSNAILTAVTYHKIINPNLKHILLISDGEPNLWSDRISIQNATRLSKKYHLKVHTVGIGSTGKVKFGYDFFDNERFVESKYDAELLKLISAETDGSYQYLLPN